MALLGEGRALRVLSTPPWNCLVSLLLEISCSYQINPSKSYEKTGISEIWATDLKMEIEGLRWERATLHEVLKSTLSQHIANLDLVIQEL